MVFLKCAMSLELAMCVMVIVVMTFILASGCCCPEEAEAVEQQEPERSCTRVKFCEVRKLGRACKL